MDIQKISALSLLGLTIYTMTTAVNAVEQSEELKSIVENEEAISRKVAEPQGYGANGAAAGGLEVKNLKTNTDVAKLKSDGFNIIELLNDEGHRQFLIELPMGTVVDEGGILTSGGEILSDTLTNNGEDQQQLKNEERDLNTENPQFFNGRLAIIASPGSENWYHWLLQILPRLTIITESGIEYDKIYIHDVNHKWQRDSLEAVREHLKIPREKLLIVNGPCVMKASTLIVPSVPFIPARGISLPKWLPEKMKDVFMKKASMDEEVSVSGSRIAPYKKIYISRQNASIRRITNEKELIRMLENDGFKILNLEQISPYDQARIFSDAEVIVGPHGSGFANLIFATPGYKLIEIDHGMADEQRSLYKGLARMTSGKYEPFYVDEVTEDHLEDDLVVDIDKLMAVLNRQID